MGLAPASEPSILSSCSTSGGCPNLFFRFRCHRWHPQGHTAMVHLDAVEADVVALSDVPTTTVRAHGNLRRAHPAVPAPDSSAVFHCSHVEGRTPCRSLLPFPSALTRAAAPPLFATLPPPSPSWRHARPSRHCYPHSAARRAHSVPAYAREASARGHPPPHEVSDHSPRSSSSHRDTPSWPCEA